MVGISHGSTSIVDIRRGSTLINEVRRGSTLVWSRTSIFDDFGRDNADTLGSDWTYHGSTTHKLGIENGTARVKIPEGLIGGFFSLEVSRAWFNVATADGDDGYVECQPSNLGSSASGGSPGGYISQVFGRVSNGTLTHGVGIQMIAGQLSIVRRVADTDTTMASAGTYQAGDVLRLTYVGNVHTLTRNGAVVGVWDDSGATASSGAGYRTLGIRGDGAKDLLGPRRFSAALDYVTMG